MGEAGMALSAAEKIISAWSIWARSRGVIFVADIFVSVGGNVLVFF